MRLVSGGFFHKIFGGGGLLSRRFSVPSGMESDGGGGTHIGDGVR